MVKRVISRLYLADNSLTLKLPEYILLFGLMLLVSSCRTSSDPRAGEPTSVPLVAPDSAGSPAEAEPAITTPPSVRVEQDYQRALSLMNNKKFLRAEQLINRVLPKAHNPDQKARLEKALADCREVLYAKVERRYTKALALAQSGDYDGAIDILIAYVGNGRDAVQDEKVTFLMGDCLYQLKEFEDAHKLYEKFINEFTETARFDDALSREFDIGFKFISGAKRSLWGMYILTGIDFGIDIVRKTLDKYPYAKPSEAYYLKLSDYLFSTGRYEEGMDRYESFVRTYPQSSSVPLAKYRIAQCYMMEYQGNDYEITPLLDAKRTVQDLLAKHPDAQVRPEAEKLRDEIANRQAERDFRVGIFYIKLSKPLAARIYFEGVVNNYPQTDWAKQAALQLSALPQAPQPIVTPAPIPASAPVPAPPEGGTSPTDKK